ncbi:hypothetical protein DH2020_021440 [Rehmannia glutinosa]|uniref:Peptidase A2 domain-containing protein n=1 Tax=Rehmannia glutinosa TaxID=99300 RepID=A0ABR0WBW9_REHGL
MATIKTYPVKVMIDSGASHCFIFDSTAHRLGLPIDDSGHTQVRLGDGKRKAIIGLCSGITLNIGSAQFQVTCYVFPLGGVDVILGVSWLATLGDVQTKWAKLTMDFWVDGKLISIRGDPSLARRGILAASIHKLQDVEECWVLWVYRQRGKQIGVVRDDVDNAGVEGAD